MNLQIRENLREAYDKSAREREASTMQAWKIEERASFLAAIQAMQKKSFLEIGAGTGRDSLFFREQGLDVICVDLSPAMVALCKEKGLDAHVMDMVNLDFPEASFDTVYSMNSLLHLRKAEFAVVLAKINKLMKPGGLVYAGIYGGYEFEGIWEDDHQNPKRFFSFFEDEQIKKEVEKVFDIYSFRCLDVDRKSSLHFQSLILERRR